MSGNGDSRMVRRFRPNIALPACCCMSRSPSPYGIGDLDRRSHGLIVSTMPQGWCRRTACPTGYGNSPYQSLSSFAGNALLISPGSLISDGL